MANLLVTGGAGYIGSVCCAELLRRGHRVTVIDDLTTGFRDAVPAAADFHQLNIADEGGVSAVLSDRRPDVVFHFASKASVADSCANPELYFRSNVTGAGVFLECLRRAGVNKFVFSSSAAVYGTPQQSPIEEDAPKSPINPYGETKLKLEQNLERYARDHGWSVISLRYFNAAGATAEHSERHNPETHAIPLLLQAAAGIRECFQIFGDDYPTPDGTCIRDYVHVLDITSAHIAALDHLQRPGMRPYNIGTGQGNSVRELVGTAQRVTGRNISVRVVGRRPGDPAVLCASPARIMREFGWRPQYSLEQIISSAWTKMDHS
jgi:UDP-glucose 4-epimerase